MFFVFFSGDLGAGDYGEKTYLGLVAKEVLGKTFMKGCFFLKGGMLMMMSPSFGFGKEWGLVTCDFANHRNTSICVI